MRILCRWWRGCYALEVAVARRRCFIPSVVRLPPAARGEKIGVGSSVGRVDRGWKQRGEVREAVTVRKEKTLL